MSLLVDQYELAMAASYLERGMNEPAVFELFVRHLPPRRHWLLCAGLGPVLALVERLRFGGKELAYLDQGIPVAGALLLAVVGPTAGRWFIDVSSGVTPKHFIRGEWFVPIAALTGLTWILVYWAGGNTWIAAGVASVIGYALRVAALWYAWEEPLASEPAGVYQHSDGRPMLGRKLKGKSQRELRDLGLLVENEKEPEATPVGTG